MIIFTFKVAFGEKGTPDNKWLRVNNDGKSLLTLSDLDLKAGVTHHVFLRAVNHVAMRSDVISRNISIETEPPAVTGKVQGINAYYFA